MPRVERVAEREWNEEWNQAQEIINEFEQRPRNTETSSNLPTQLLPGILTSSTFPVHRVAQLDASELDNEVESILSHQLKRSFRFFPTSLTQFWQPEMLLALRIALFRASIWNFQSTYGQRLQNLTYRNERAHQKTELGSSFKSSPFSNGRHVALSKKQLIFYAIFWILGRYGIERLNWYCSSRGWADEPDDSKKRKFWLLLRWVEKIAKLLDFINLIAFLSNGRYISFIERILFMRLVPGTRSMPRQISFEFMNRQIVWQTFSEFLLFILPLLNIGALKKLFIRHIWGPKRKNLPIDTCPVCLKSPVNTPHVPDCCGHIYCYYCIRSAMEEDSKFTCFCCGKKVNEIKWQRE